MNHGDMIKGNQFGAKSSFTETIEKSTLEVKYLDGTFWNYTCTSYLLFVNVAYFYCKNWLTCEGIPETHRKQYNGHFDEIIDFLHQFWGLVKIFNI